MTSTPVFRVFAFKLKVELMWFPFPLVIIEMFLLINWSPHTDLAGFGKADPSLHKVSQSTVWAQTKYEVKGSIWGLVGKEKETLAALNVPMTKVVLIIYGNSLELGLKLNNHRRSRWGDLQPEGRCQNSSFALHRLS